MRKPLWIWYPRDFEKWLQEQVLMRRDFRRVLQPPFWRPDSGYHKIRFSSPIPLQPTKRSPYIPAQKLPPAFWELHMTHSIWVLFPTPTEA